MLGYVSYSIYTTCLTWNEDIKHEYGDAFGSSSLVTKQDCFFALHGALITALTIGQCVVYERGGQTVSRPALAFTATAVVGTLSYGLVIACSGRGGDHDGGDGDSVSLLSWLALVYWLSVVKLAVTVCKYVPQARLNYVNIFRLP